MKYQVGDKVRIKSLDWYNENKGNADKTNSVWCEDGSTWFFYHMSQYCGKIMTIKNVWAYSYTLEGSDSRWTDEMIEGLVSRIGKGTRSFARGQQSHTKPSSELYEEYLEGLVEEKITNVMDENKMLIGWIKEPNRYRLVPDKDYEIKYDEKGFFYLEKKKKEYPKTYEECCKVLSLGEDGRLYTKGYKASLIQNFQRLFICRDAYWKIAGEEMGLGKSWKPDYNDLMSISYGLYNELKYSIINPAQFLFPTEEMRDEFYKNFKELIEACK